MSDITPSVREQPIDESDLLRMTTIGVQEDDHRPLPRGVPAPAPIDTARLASIVMAIARGVSLSAAQDAGLVRGDAEVDAWGRMAEDVEAMRERGEAVDVESEWFG